MSGDYSRYVFDPSLDYHGVQLQQGRPLTDWDWNDATAQINRHAQAGRYDTFGPVVVPNTTPNAFVLTLSGGDLLIGPGRLYVDGLLAENHGGGAPQWDPALAELRGSDPLSYLEQKHFPNPPPLPAPGPLNLVYIDVWQREVTAIEAPDLLERALGGVDTTTRIQTIWQVKLFENVDGGSVDCNTPLDQIPGWTAAHPPAGGRLTTATGNPTEDDPCLIPPKGGYKGLENQLYRVEIHDGGDFGTATFKWSRNNASVVVRVSQIVASDAHSIVVESTGKDKVLGFNDGDWVEVTDDWRELNNLPGQMLRIALGGVDDATRTITFEDVVDTALFPNATLAARNTRLKRWDEQGQVFLGDGTPYVDLDGTADGLIKVPPAGTPIALESGVLVSFDLDTTNGGLFRSGDYWMFAARVAGAWLEPLDHAPPRGIHHHYATLGFTTLDDTPHNCPPHWPPSGGGDCCCTVCVSAATHNDGSATIQDAIKQVIDAGGGTVCLETGTYNITQTLQIANAEGLRIVGQGIATQLVATATPALQVESARVLDLRDFAVQIADTDDGGGIGLNVVRADVLTLDALYIRTAGAHPQGTAIRFAGVIAQAEISRCHVYAGIGLALASDDSEQSYRGDVLHVADNTFHCSAYAIDAPLLRPAMLEFRCVGNVVDCEGDAAFRLIGTPGSRGRIEITDNRLLVTGNGILAGIDGLDIRDNQIRHQGGEKESPALRDGIVLARSGDLATSPIDNLRITGNHIVLFNGAAIVATTPVGAALIKQNRAQRCGLGIVLGGGGSAEVSIENNQIDDVLGTGRENTSALGIAAIGIPQVQIRDNVLARIAREAKGVLIATAIVTQKCERIAIDGNVIVDFAPPQDFKGFAVGILVLEPFIDAALHDNEVMRSAGTFDADSSPWYAIGMFGHAPSGDIGIKGANKKGPTPEVAAFTADVAKFGNVLKTPKNSKLKPTATTAPGHQRALVRGNQLAGYGATPLVAIVAGDDGDFSGNQCHVQGKHGDQSPGVVLFARTLTVNGNRVTGSVPVAFAMLAPGAHAATVGNISSGQIRLNGAPLAAPWAALNLVGV